MVHSACCLYYSIYMVYMAWMCGLNISCKYQQKCSYLRFSDDHFRKFSLIMSRIPSQNAGVKKLISINLYSLNSRSALSWKRFIFSEVDSEKYLPPLVLSSLARLQSSSVSNKLDSQCWFHFQCELHELCLAV